MGMMSWYTAIWAITLATTALCNAQTTVPILETQAVPTVVPSLVTIYSGDHDERWIR
jgi:hypothetical protein